MPCGKDFQKFIHVDLLLGFHSGVREFLEIPRFYLSSGKVGLRCIVRVHSVYVMYVSVTHEFFLQRLKKVAPANARANILALSDFVVLGMGDF